MTDHELKNWEKIKEVMEASGNTDNMFYKRAIAILKTKIDPLAHIFPSNNE